MLGWVFNRKKLLKDHKLLGKWGEKRSRKYLTRKGFHCLADNQSFKTGELDLVMLDREGTVVFVEVKTRAGEDFSSAESALTGVKRTRLTRAARSFLVANSLTERPCRFDLITIILGKTGEPDIRHYQNAFSP